MYRRDAESNELKEWARQLGYPAQLQAEEIQRLLTPNLRSVWRHLKTLVKPVRSVETIRKNLLLAKLRRENITPNQIGNFSIQSCEELTLVKRMSDTQREINSKNIERKAVNEEINSLTCKIAVAKHNIISKKNTVKEIENKVQLMNLKLTQCKEEIEKLDEDHSIAKLLEMFQLSGSCTADSSNILNIATRLLNNEISAHESQCEEDQMLLLAFSKEYSVKTLYQAFVLASDNIYKSLKCFTANLEFPEENIKDDLVSNETLSFSNHLKHLNALIINNQLSIVDNLENLKKESAVLNDEKKVFVNLIKEMSTIRNNDFNTYPITEAEDFVERLVNNSLSSTKAVVLKDVIVQLETECFEYDNLKHLVENITKEYKELQNEVAMKVNLINELYFKIYKYNTKIDEVKSEIKQLCNDAVFNFFNEMRRQKDIENVISDSEHVLFDEIKMFYDMPLCALMRRWENVSELLSSELIEKLSSDPELLVFLLQSEPKNILNHILEIKWWSCNLANNN